MYSAFVFDFDGVIIEEGESVFKERAWEDVAVAFKFGTVGRKAREEAVRRYAGGRGTRFEILKDSFSALGYDEREIPNLVMRAADLFQRAYIKAVVATNVAPCDRHAIEVLAKRFPLYIDTVTPQQAMCETINALQLTEQFRGVYGMPTTKPDILRRVLREVGCAPERVCFIGDGDHDYAAAQETGCHFIGRANKHNQWTEPKPFPLIHSLEELLPYAL